MVTAPTSKDVDEAFKKLPWPLSWILKPAELAWTNFLRWFFKAFTAEEIVGDILWCILMPTVQIYTTLSHLFPKIAVFFGEAVTSAFREMPDGWAGFVSGYMSTFTTAKQSKESVKTPAGRELVYKNIAKDTFADMLALILPATRPEGGIAPLDGIRGAEKYLSINMKFQMDAWLLHLIGDFFSMGKIKSLKDLPNAISWSFGLGWLSWLVMGTPFKMTIADPMEQYFNTVYRPTRLNPAQAAEAVRKGMITASQYNLLMATLGYPDWITNIIFKLSYKDLPDTILRRLYSLQLITEDQLIKEYQRKGYTQAQAVLLSKLFALNRKLDLIDKVVDEATDQYKAGFLTFATLSGYLDQAGYNPEEQALLISLLDLQKLSKNQLSNSELRGLVYKSLISRDDALKVLTQRGMDPSDTSLYIELGRPMLTASDIRAAFVKKLISDNIALSLLKALGWYDEQAKLYLILTLPKEE